MQGGAGPTFEPSFKVKKFRKRWSVCRGFSEDAHPVFLASCLLVCATFPSPPAPMPCRAMGSWTHVGRAARRVRRARRHACGAPRRRADNTSATTHSLNSSLNSLAFPSASNSVLSRPARLHQHHTTPQRVKQIPPMYQGARRRTLGRTLDIQQQQREEKKNVLWTLSAATNFLEKTPKNPPPPTYDLRTYILHSHSHLRIRRA